MTGSIAFGLPYHFFESIARVGLVAISCIAFNSCLKLKIPKDYIIISILILIAEISIHRYLVALIGFDIFYYKIEYKQIIEVMLLAISSACVFFGVKITKPISVGNNQSTTSSANFILCITAILVGFIIYNFRLISDFERSEIQFYLASIIFSFPLIIASKSLFRSFLVREKPNFRNQDVIQGALAIILYILIGMM